MPAKRKTPEAAPSPGLQITILPDSVAQITSRHGDLGPFSMARFDVYIGDTTFWDPNLEEGFQIRLSGFLYHPLGLEKSYENSIGYVRAPSTYTRGSYARMTIIDPSRPMLHSLKESLLSIPGLREQIGLWSGPNGLSINEYLELEHGWSPYK